MRGLGHRGSRGLRPASPGDDHTEDDPDKAGYTDRQGLTDGSIVMSPVI